jgi:hypothetical protein
MTSSTRTRIFLVIALLAIATLALYPYKNVELVFLTWEHENTSHNMTINYIPGGTSKTAMVYYDTTSRNGDPDNYRYKKQGEIRSYPGVNFSVHSTHLGNLDPEQTYYFVVGDEVAGYSSERMFRTVPEKGDIRFVSGGDASVSDTFEEVCEIAAESNPHFAIIGGDFAYANGDINSQHLWLDLLDIWQDTMKTPEGYTIPVIAAIGNHEVATSNQPPKKPPTQLLSDNAPFYYIIFHPADDKTFFKRKIGKDTILFVLDTDHIYPSDGEQLEWMNKSFAEHSNDRFRFTSYHVPLYPSFRDPESTKNALLRKNWLHVFDQHQLDVAFENHEHTLKKSKILRNNKISDSQGTIYIGDGSWGKVSRQPVDRWYIESTRPVNHVWVVTLSEHNASFKALTIDGIDENYTFEISASSNLITQ